MKDQPGSHQFVDWFRNSTPYIKAHRGKTFVILVGGETIQEETFAGLIHDIALLNTLGVRLILVHGARPQIEAQLQQAGIQSHIEQGLRITDEQSLPHVQQAVGKLRMDIEALFSMGLANSPMAGAQVRITSGNLVIARPMGVREGVDFAHTGEVRRIDVDAIRHHLNQESIILLSPIGYSPTGEIFSLRAEEVATAVATHLKSDKLIFLVDKTQLCSNKGDIMRQLNTAEAEHCLKQQYSSPLENAIKAVKQGVRRVHLIDRSIDGGLLQELFTRDGVGSLISSDSYDTVRQATIDDIAGILELIEPLEKEGILVRRSRELLEMEIDYFTVMERDGMIIGCTALYPFVEDNMAEIACLAIHPDYQNAGRGDQLLATVEKAAVRNSFSSVFALSVRTSHWFLERGYVESGLDTLPVKKKFLYNCQRKSKVFYKKM